ncbi:MAG TPA: RNA methyltransferase, partial [Chitinophagaceae bacterium]|nr:RNA methyltransferase [Chitinophagaceae bacterium]
SAIAEWSEASVQLCSQRQQRIVADAWPALKNDGILVYCTCSYSLEEDEEVVDWVLDGFMASGLKLAVDPSWNIVESFSPKHKVPCYRFYPDKVKGEGFFLACLQKNEGGQAVTTSRQKTEKLSKHELQWVNEWIVPGIPAHLFRHKDDIIAVPPGFETIIPLLQDRLYLRQAGITIGKIAKDGLIPEHSLALSRMVDNSIPVLPLDREQALQYLRKADFSTGTSNKGWALVQYDGHNLGWVKILSNRLNNYYPKEWRILQQPKNP